MDIMADESTMTPDYLLIPWLMRQLWTMPERPVLWTWEQMQSMRTL